MKELILKNKLLAIIIGVIVVIGGGTVAFFLLKEEKDNYVVKFEGAEISKIEVMEGNYLKEPENPTKDGYKFVGWYLNGELFDFSKPIEGNITLEARWEKYEKEEIPEMTAELAAQLFDEYKNTHFENPEEYEYKNITVNAKGDNHSYLIGYDEYHQGEELGNVGVIMQYKDGRWDFSLPGSSMFIDSELEKYNFVWLNDDIEEIPQDVKDELLKIAGIRNISDPQSVGMYGPNLDSVFISSASNVIKDASMDYKFSLILAAALDFGVKEYFGEEYYDVLPECEAGSGKCTAIKIEDFKNLSKKYGITDDTDKIVEEGYGVLKKYNNYYVLEEGGYIESHNMKYDSITFKYDGNSIVLVTNISLYHLETNTLDTQKEITYRFNQQNGEYYLYSVNNSTID